MKKQTPNLSEFLWGVATAAHQVEGHQDNDWSRWEQAHAERLPAAATERYHSLARWESISNNVSEPSNYISGSAADHFNRYQEDIAHMRALSINSYRFSIEWSRIEPRPGQFDKVAIAHYRSVLMELHKADITPFVSLHHFTNPLWLEDYGGWHSASFPGYFARYAGKIAEELGDLIPYFVTVNEPESYLISRYLDSPIWPGWPNQEMSLSRYIRARRSFRKAHIAAYKQIVAIRPQARVGFTHGVVYFEGKGLFTRTLARVLDRFGGTGLYKHFDGYQDFLGLQYYTRGLIKLNLSHPKDWLQVPDGSATNDMGWEIYPEGLYKLLKKLHHHHLPIFITENGIADADDTQRADFITSHIDALDKAKAEGIDVRGYFYWSLLDNFEWSSGHWPRFGLITYDPVSKDRQIRKSAWAYRDIIEQDTQ